MPNRANLATIMTDPEFNHHVANFVTPCRRNDKSAS